MGAFRFTHFHLGAVVATSFAFLMLPRAGYAYTADQQQACSGDAFRLCSSEIPDVDRITACMIRNKAQLSPDCRVFFYADPEAEAAASAAGSPVDIRPGVARKVRVTPHKIKKLIKPAAN